MLSKLKLMFSFYIFMAIIIICISFFAFFITKKYKEKRIKLYALFMDISKREVILLSCSLFTLFVNIFLHINVKVYSNLFMYMLIFSSVIFIIFALNIRLILLEIFYLGSELLIINLLTYVNNYINYVFFDKMIVALKIVFIVLACLYGIYIFVRKVEILLKNNKYVRRNLYE